AARLAGARGATGQRPARGAQHLSRAHDRPAPRGQRAVHREPRGEHPRRRGGPARADLGEAARRAQHPGGRRRLRPHARRGGDGPHRPRRARLRARGAPAAGRGRPDQVLRGGRGRRHRRRARVVPLVLPPGPAGGRPSVRPGPAGPPGARGRHRARARGLRRRRDRLRRRRARPPRRQRVAELRALPGRGGAGDRRVPRPALRPAGGGGRAGSRTVTVPREPGPRSREIVAREARHIAPGYQSFALYSELAMARGSGSRLWDEDGNEYIDFIAGIAVGSIGHCHPHYVEALKRQAERLTFGSFTTETRARFLELMAKVTPEGLTRIQLFSGGAEAVEAGLRLAKAATGRHEVVGFWGGFHGKTGGVLGLLG